MICIFQSAHDHNVFKFILPQFAIGSNLESNFLCIQYMIKISHLSNCISYEISIPNSLGIEMKVLVFFLCLYLQASDYSSFSTTQILSNASYFESQFGSPSRSCSYWLYQSDFLVWLWFFILYKSILYVHRKQFARFSCQRLAVGFHQFWSVSSINSQLSTGTRRCFRFGILFSCVENE